MTDQHAPEQRGGVEALSRAIDAFLNAWADAVRPIFEGMTAFLNGYTVIENDLVEPGKPITDGATLYMHPVDARLATERYGTGIHAALDASLDWQHERIALAADRATARITRYGSDRANGNRAAAED